MRWVFSFASSTCCSGSGQVAASSGSSAIGTRQVAVPSAVVVGCSTDSRAPSTFGVVALGCLFGSAVGTLASRGCVATGPSQPADVRGRAHCDLPACATPHAVARTLRPLPVAAQRSFAGAGVAGRSGRLSTHGSRCRRCVDHCSGTARSSYIGPPCTTAPPSRPDPTCWSSTASSLYRCRACPGHGVEA